MSAVRWYLDKKSQIPLYLQLKELIKYYISTGIIKNGERLPGVIQLAQELKINFETVRKAYKELEKEGLISVNRGRGSFALLPHGTSSPKKIEEMSLKNEDDLEDVLKKIINRWLQQGKGLKEIKSLVRKIFKEIDEAAPQPFIIFTECNLPQARQVASLLEDQLKIRVKPVLVSELKNELNKIPQPEITLLAVVTTGFHLNEVRKIVADLPVDIHVLINQMSPENWQKLASLDKKTRLAFICKDPETITLYEDLLRAELGENILLSTSLIEEEDKLKEIINSADVILATPAALAVISDLVPPEKPVFNVFDRIDPLTLKMLQTSISQKMGLSSFRSRYQSNLSS
jgi:DNA-binding transcriptional regulator YhcF (GntR family)